MKPVHILQHVSFEGPGHIATWCRNNNVSVTKTEFFKPDWKLPGYADFGAIVIMGGPMSVHDEQEYPWLSEEKRFIELAIGQQKPIFGVCLGAQLIASVLGARVYKGNDAEIGWFPIQKTEEGKNPPLLSAFPEQLTVFHWHGDTYDLPAGAVNLFQSAGCTNQALLFKNNILGFQFHIEVTPEDIEGFLSHNGADLAQPGKYVQSANEIRAANSNTKNLLMPLESFLVQFLLQ